MGVIYAPQSGGGFNPMGILSTVLSLFPGAQPFGMALGAANSLAKGNPLGAITSVAKMGTGNNSDFGVSKGLSDLNATTPEPNLDTDFSAKGIVANMPQQQLKDQDYYNNKWNSLTDMYGVKDNTGFNADLAKDYYKDDGIFSALSRMYNWG